MPPVRIQILASRPSCRPPLVTGYQPKSVVFRKLTRRKLARVQSIIRVAESISSFGGRVTVKELLAFSAFAVLTTPPAPGTSSSVETSAPLTWAGVQSGWSSRSRAAAPDTTAVAMDVPPARKYLPSTTQPGQRCWKSLPWASVDTRPTPGARTSGLRTPSWVSPRLDHGASESSPRIHVPLSSSAPTVTTHGSLAGANVTPSWVAPSLPAAATTVRPLNQACSTAASSGSVRYDSAVIDASERFTTRIPSAALLSTANWSPLMTSSTVVLPSSSETLTETMFARGATP